MDRQTELGLIKRLRAQSYRTRESRIADIKAGRTSSFDLMGFTQEELEHLLPGRRLSWIVNVARFTDHPHEPIFLECEAVVDASPKRLIVDRANGIITFQDDGCSTRTVRMSAIFDFTVRVIPPRKMHEPKRVPRHMHKKLQQKKLVVG